MKYLGKIKVIHLYYLIMIFSVIIIISTLVKYQLIDSAAERERISKIRYEIKEIYAKRGSIISADGHKLSFDIEKYNIILDPNNIKEELIKPVVEILAKYTNKEEKELEEKIINAKNNNRRFLDLKVELDYITNRELEKEILKLKKSNKDTNTIWLASLEISERYNIEGKEFETIVGYLNKEGNAVYGVENYYNTALTGKKGRAKTYIPTSKANKEYTLNSIIGDEIIEEAQKGNNIHLTIDTVMQYTVDSVIKETYEQFQAESVMAILMEADTGKIIALDSYPKSTSKLDVKNRPITDLFEPGSIFKPITVASAIEEKLINKNTIIHSDGFIRVKDRIINDHDNTTKGSLTVSQIIAHSGNVAMVKIAQLMENETYYNYLKKFGLAEKTDIDTSFEFNGKLFPLKSFTEVRKSNVSFGQGISMTQIQMLTSLNATINGGYVLKPYVVDKITDEKNNIIMQNERQVKYKPIGEETSEQIRSMLENVVKTGTGRQIALEGYRIGGKTGTAQKAGAKGYEKGKYFSSFFAFLPADKPKYSILITVNEPKGAYYGAAVALPPAKKIVEKLIKYKGLIPLNVDNVDEKEIVEVEKKVIKTSLNVIKKDLEKGIMPNLVGLSLKEFLSLNVYAKYPNIVVNGSGLIQTQNIEQGQNIDKDSLIILELK